MFSKELENLIQATLEDGVLEEYEKAALVKRAQNEGVDLTELEIYIQSILQRRKRELAKEALDPKLKKELLAELQKNELLIEEYIKYPRDEDSMRILRLYYIKLYEKFGGDRREQDTDNEALFKQIDDRYNELNKG